MSKSSKSSQIPQPESYEAAATELEQIVTTMETGDLSLEESLSAYKRGAELLQYCQNKLQGAQQQIQILEADMLKNFKVTEIDDQ